MTDTSSSLRPQRCSDMMHLTFLHCRAIKVTALCHSDVVDIYIRETASFRRACWGKSYCTREMQQYEESLMMSLTDKLPGWFDVEKRC